jgi:hypothetical protein
MRAARGKVTALEKAITEALRAATFQVQCPGGVHWLVERVGGFPTKKTGDNSSKAGISAWSKARILR